MSNTVSVIQQSTSLYLIANQNTNLSINVVQATNLTVSDNTGATINLTIAKPIITVSESSGTNLTVEGVHLSLVEVSSQGIAGPMGPPGAAVTFLTKTSSIAISSDRVVQTSGNDLVSYADKDDLTSISKVLGVTLNAAIIGAIINIQVGGEIVEPTWNWDISKPIYLGSTGYLTQVVPITGFILQVAIPVSPTKINVDIRQPILLS